jgi:hypothetical protein
MPANIPILRGWLSEKISLVYNTSLQEKSIDLPIALFGTTRFRQPNRGHVINS